MTHFSTSKFALIFTIRRHLFDQYVAMQDEWECFRSSFSFSYLFIVVKIYCSNSAKTTSNSSK